MDQRDPVQQEEQQQQKTFAQHKSAANTDSDRKNQDRPGRTGADTSAVNVRNWKEPSTPRRLGRFDRIFPETCTIYAATVSIV